MTCTAVAAVHRTARHRAGGAGRGPPSTGPLWSGSRRRGRRGRPLSPWCRSASTRSPARGALGTSSCIRFKTRRNVDSPQPDGPINAVTEDGGMWRETRSRTFRSPNPKLLGSVAFVPATVAPPESSTAHGLPAESFWMPSQPPRPSAPEMSSVRVPSRVDCQTPPPASSSAVNSSRHARGPTSSRRSPAAACRRRSRWTQRDPVCGVGVEVDAREGAGGARLVALVGLGRLDQVPGRGRVLQRFEPCAATHAASSGDRTSGTVSPTTLAIAGTPVRARPRPPARPFDLFVTAAGKIVPESAGRPPIPTGTTGNGHDRKIDPAAAAGPGVLQL